jgi:energy-converting hydrogenase Eha subunit B
MDLICRSLIAYVNFVIVDALKGANKRIQLAAEKLKTPIS